MDKMSEYYSPNSDDLILGLEIDYRDDKDDDWETTTIKGWAQMRSLFLDYFLRVKYLDREDIESFSLDPEKYKIEKNFGYYHISERIVQGEMDYWSIRYSGTIKNKAELKRLLKQLDIWKTKN